MNTRAVCLLAVAFALPTHNASAAPYRNPYGKLPANATPGDRMFADYFRAETRLLAERSLADIRTLEDWSRHKITARQQLFEMLGLDPVPPRTDLKATITGTLDHPEFTVEKLHYQSRPGLYVTANVYVPKNLSAPAPAILYVCGHANVKINGVSYGSKASYQHWGAWFARNGYVCVVIDTVQLGEIEGIHHGTSREGLWWWNSRGYSSAAAEAWNCIRALDYLQS
ncbi:MAG: acetylxylan esterase, partial [Verrucomicrobia bacterium]|nr:acetylxylan esterase [Verrucomicrobiota bacterium]